MKAKTRAFAGQWWNNVGLRGISCKRKSRCAERRNNDESFYHSIDDVGDTEGFWLVLLFTLSERVQLLYGPLR